MKEDIITRLREKEVQMEALIEGARSSSSRIRAEGAAKAREIKDTLLRELEEELKAFEAREEEKIRKEVEEIEREAEAAVVEVKRRGALGKDAALKALLKLVTEGP